MLTWSHGQREEVHATWFVLRAVQGCHNDLHSSLALHALVVHVLRSAHVRESGRRTSPPARFLDTPPDDHIVGDEVEGVDVDGAVVEAGVVGESENAVAVTHDNQRRHLRGPMLRSGHALQTASE